MIKSSLFVTMVVGLFLLGCTKYPDQYDAEREKDVSVTYYDKTAEFDEYFTYSIVDTVGFVESDGDSLIVVPSKRSEVILAKINSRMEGMGYTQVDTSQNPDVLINAHLISLDVEYVGYVGGYWDMGYYYGYDPYYGSSSYWGYGGYSYYYPYAYPYYYSSSYGAVLVEMIDKKNMNDNSKQFKMVWTAIIAGTDNSTSDINTRITSGLDECFDQSSYLAH